jgi:hypothetical protein
MVLTRNGGRGLRKAGSGSVAGYYVSRFYACTPGSYAAQRYHLVVMAMGASHDRKREGKSHLFIQRGEHYMMREGAES